MPPIQSSRARARFAVVLTAVWFAGSACGGAEPQLSARAARGQEVAERAGCAACHGGLDTDATIGPSWVGSWGTEVLLDDGRRVVFDADHVRRSVREPDADRLAGDWMRMPAYGPDQISAEELDDIVEYLRALGSP
jgi:mono/diheme cytochrome c family protein